MSHHPLTPAQRQHLAIATAEGAVLARVIYASRNGATFTGLQWLSAASTAAAIAAQYEQIAVLAPTQASRDLWTKGARTLRDTVARFELWAELAEVGSDATTCRTA